MASNTTTGLSVFKEPRCLIYTGKDGKLKVASDLIAELESLDKSLVVVAIAGLYRTGKSYLMNRLAGKTDGFALGSTIQSKTKGVWIWVCDHPLHSDRYLVLLDTEGLGDVKKGDQNHDNWIFALATLLSSTLVYNAFGAIDEGALTKLNFVTEMSKHIKTKSANHKGDDTDFDCYFPLFIFVLRDFSLDLELDDKKVTPDQYLEDSLQLQKGTSEAIIRYNRPRLCIRKYFKKRKCFTFDRPVYRKKLKHLENLGDSELSPDFVEEARKFVNFVYAKCPVKKLETGQHLNGRMFAVLVTTYVDAVRNGAVPCVEDAIKSLSLIENSRAVEGGVQLYTKDMECGIKLPTKDDETLNNHHFSCLQKAVKYFLDKAIMDEDNQFQKELNDKIKGKYKYFIQANAKASVQKCRALLEQLETTLRTKFERGDYAKNGGFAEFQQDLRDIQQKYKKHTDLGVQMSQTLLDYLQEKLKEGDAVLAADKKVTAEEKKAEAERQKALEANRKKQAAEKEAERMEQYAKEKERALQENIKQMEESNARQMKEMTDHYDKVMNDRMGEQKRLLEEGFQREANQLREEIERQENIRRTEEKNKTKQMEEIKEHYDRAMNEQRRQLEERFQTEVDGLREEIDRLKNDDDDEDDNETNDDDDDWCIIL